jgi:hypothetical protein
MIGLEVHLNGRRLCVAGADDLAVLSAGLTVAGPLGAKTARNRRSAENSRADAPIPRLHVGGLTGRGDADSDVHLRWCRDAAVSIGDVVELRLVNIEAAEADAPDPDATPHEESERRAFERAKARYFALRDKYDAREL